ncbi:MAG: rRNA maturation RNase YbeY [Croceivirga sp.]
MGINYNYEVDFKLENEKEHSDWIDRVVTSEGFTYSDLNYIFCDDEYLVELNRKYLNHNTYTDIITFDYGEGKCISGDIFISKERVEENASVFKVSVIEELKRVMVHGVLHLLGYGDKGAREKEEMRRKENEKIKMFHVEQ